MNGKLVLITGASRGIGAGIARRLAREGYSIAINYRGEGEREEAAAVKAECEALGASAGIYMADVTDFAACDAMIKAIADQQGPIYGLVNNAGIVRDGLLMRMSPEQFNDVISTNLTSVYNVTKPVTAHMLRAKLPSARIVSISSVVGLQGNAGQTNYAAAKAGIVGFTKSLSKEIGSRNITANAIAPGYISTPMTSQLSDEVRDAMMNSVSLRRMGTVEDIAGAVNFLLSEDASYITGQVLSIDGGISL